MAKKKHERPEAPKRRRATVQREELAPGTVLTARLKGREFSASVVLGDEGRPEEEYTVPFGLAEVRREGRDVTVVATAYMVSLALRAAAALEERDVRVEIIDPHTLEPLDIETIVQSVRKTGRLVVVDEDTERCGVGAEIAVQVMERAFGALKAPVQRVANPNLPVPYSRPLERAVLPSKEKIERAILQTLAAPA